MNVEQKKTKQNDTTLSYRLPRHARVRMVAVFVSLFLLIAVFSSVLIGDWYFCLPDEVSPTFVGRQSCVTCHADQAKLHHNSHHDLAMDLATAETVLAKFDGQTLEHYGIESKFFMKDDKYFVSTEGEDGEIADFEVKYVFGYEPLQQYMVELDPPGDDTPGAIGRVQVLRLTWDTQKKKWFYLSPPDVKEKLDPSDPLHWTGITQCWNTSCADCHSTNLQKNFDVDSQTYSTTYSEIDVSCESCHGPGSVHVELAQNRTFFWDRKHGYGLPKLKGEDSHPQIETCANCHSRRRVLAHGFKANSEFHDFYNHELLFDHTYHLDGQIKDEDYVYGSFIQSKMYHMGIRCTDCHDPHSTKVKFQTNQLCTSCHAHPAAKYDTQAHHHHKDGSEGARCVECHMPETTYMEVDPRRDHSLRIPRPDLSVKVGSPNVCTGCHLEPEKLPAADRKPLKQYGDWLLSAQLGNETIKKELKRLDQWSLDTVEQWYGKKERPEHFAEVWKKVRDGEPGSSIALSELVDNRTVPNIVRATSAFELARYDDTVSLDAALSALTDKDPTVIVSAMGRVEGEIGRLNGMVGRMPTSDLNRQYEKLVDPIVKLLTHPSLLVRTESARALAGIPQSVRSESLIGDDRKSFNKAIQEFEQTMMVNSDRAASLGAIGNIAEGTGDFRKAKRMYRQAVRIEPHVSGPRRNLARILDSEAQQLDRQIRSMAQQGIKGGEPIIAQIAKLSQEIQRLRNEELEIMKVDVQRAGDDPNAHGLHYFLGMELYLSGEIQGAEKSLLKAVELSPQSEQYLYGLAVFYQAFDRWEEAAEYCQKLLDLAPSNVPYTELMQQIREKRKQ